MADPRPLQPWQRPPFEKGHTLTMKHGAWSPRRVDPLATELVEQVAGGLDYLTADPSYRPALWAWARAEARVQLLSEWLDDHGPLDDDGTPRPALDALHRFERLAADARSRLGLDPLSRARLGRDVTAATVDLARLMAEDAEREAEEQAAGGHQSGQDGPRHEAGE